MCLIAINFIWPFNKMIPYVGKFAEWIRLENWNSFARLFSVFYARKNSTEMCVTDFWTVVFVLFRYKSSRVKLEEYEISSRTQLTFEERESERKLDKEKEEEIRGVYMKHYKEQKFACVCCFCWTLSVVRPCSATIKKCTLILSVL